MKYSVQATRKDGSGTYLVYDGWQTEDREKAENTARECNNMWGNQIRFEVVPVETAESKP